MGDDDFFARRRREDGLHRSANRGIVAMTILAMSLVAAVGVIERKPFMRAAEPPSLASVSTESTVLVDIDFGFGPSYALSKPRASSRASWPSYCEQCGRKVTDQNWPVEMWCHEDGSRCFVGCFECWKKAMALKRQLEAVREGH